MPILYKGAGPGSFWDTNDARTQGFTAHSPGILASSSRLIQHIARGTVAGPYISLTRSFGVAWDYAVYCGRSRPVANRANPGYIYEVELDDPLPPGLVILDPIREIAQNAPGPLATVPYQHDGSPQFLLGVVRPTTMKKHLAAPCRQAPPGTGTSRTPNLTPELEALIRTLRDAEILALGAIPSACVRNRFSVYP